MNVDGIEGLTPRDLYWELKAGGRFVLYQYCISVIILTFRRTSDICFIRAGQHAVSRGLPYTLLSLFLGWWGIPWGPIWTIQSLVVNLGGGKDVTNEVIESLAGLYEDPRVSAAWLQALADRKAGKPPQTEPHPEGSQEPAGATTEPTSPRRAKRRVILPLAIGSVALLLLLCGVTVVCVFIPPPPPPITLGVTCPPMVYEGQQISLVIEIHNASSDP